MGQVNVNTDGGGDGGASGVAILLAILALAAIVLLVLWLTGVLNFGGTTTTSDFLRLLAG